MKTFEEHLRQAERELAQKRARKPTREERRVRAQRRMTIITGLVFLTMAILLIIGSLIPHSYAEEQPGPQPMEKSAPEEPIQEDYENEKIEDALFDSGYFRSDIPLDGDTQALLHAACDESGVPYELALAVIWKETGYRNVLGDDGSSTGYMQVQERWHRDRMERLGVTDLSDPSGNFRVGCDYLAELMSKYPLEDALTAYNSGSPGKSEYASSVIEHYGILKGAKIL